MSKTGLILAFYRDHSAAQEALQLLRQKGVRRVATLRRHPDGHFSQSRKLSSPAATVLGGALGALLGRYSPLPRAANAMIAPALGAAFGATAGYFGAQGGDGSLPDAVLKRQRQWLLRGDTVLVAQADGDRLGEVMDVLRDSGQPAVFVLRPDQKFHEDADESALRGENFSSEKFREAARRLSERHRDAKLPEGSHSQSHRRLIQRLKANNRLIASATKSLLEAARLDIPVSIAAEWLLDNSYIVEGQTKDALNNLSRQFYEELPVLPAQVAATLAHAGHLPEHDVPRVYALAVELVAQADSRLDKANIAEFVQAYQATTPLAMGELWALPLMLRVAIVENLRRLASRIARHQNDRENAALWANRLLNAAHHDADNVPRLLADLAQQHPRPGAHFADRLVSNLFDEEAALLPARSWLEGSLRVSLDEAQRTDQRRQAVDQMTVANCVTSLKHLGDMDWNNVFESLSLVESELRHDPSGVYAAMNFATRDRYRHEVEILARGSKQSEGDIARRVVSLSGASDLDAPDEMRRHIGYYLIGDGRQEFEAGLTFQPKLRLQTQRFLQNHATPLYLGGIAVGTGSVLALGAYLGRRAGTKLSAPLLLLGVLPASEIAVQIVNYLVTRTLPSEALPKMNFEKGVPGEWKTIVVVPTLLISEASIHDDLEQLEIHYLASGDSNLRFALLGDFADAPEAHLSSDSALLEIAQQGINGLNARYRAGGDRFFLFNRGRVWSDSEERWMGTERKRGKLEELNRYLKGDWSGNPDESHPVAGNEARLKGIRFVITLDADTQMPHDTARRLIETLAHPLNRPQFSAEFQTPDSALRPAQAAPANSALVKRGYTLIQPRVTTTLPSATATRFARWFSDSMGRDPYTHVVSDVHQDLFREGSYHGKGIYDLDSFYAVLNNRFPPATLLSHDLLEGAHVRVGYASDIEFLDDFPANYLTFAKRQHRWIRGDWQILDWIFGMVPTAQRGVRVMNPLSIISRWKIGDNLRRSLLPVGTTAFLVAGWLSGPTPAKVVTGLVLGNLFWPVIAQAIAWLTTNPTNPQKIKYLRQEAPTILPNVVRSAVWAGLLPHQTVLALDAVSRVLYRKFYSHKSMLEWETAKVAGQSAAQREQAFLWRLGRGAVFAGGVALAVRAMNPAGFVFAAPLLAPWAAMPALVKWLSGRWATPPQEIESADREYLRGIARQTWRYFDDFVGPQTHWLAPDNYQERLRVEIAQRTSPTNIGMWLLAVEAARDFGYISGDDAIGRLLSTLKSLESIEKHRGHLFNWYQVQTTQPLPPRYISVVDSGNLLGCLWTLSEGIRQQNENPVLTGAALNGLADTLALLRASLASESIAVSLEDDLAELSALVENGAALPLIEIVRRLHALDKPLAQIEAAINAQPLKTSGQRQTANLVAETGDPRFATSADAYWSAQLASQTAAWLQLADRYLLWVEILDEAPEEWLWPLGENSPALRRELLADAPSLVQLAAGKVEALNELLAHTRDDLPEQTRLWLEKLQNEFGRSRWLAGEMLSDAAELIDRTENLADEMDFGFLYDAERKLFPIGFNVEENRLDTSYYDLLASECRLASFMAVARGDVPAEHWMTLGRRFGLAPDNTPVLLSWSGTMFEYLMPLIFTESYENSLLDWACKGAVRQQKLYAKARNVPWGISEAAFSALDAQKTYQYKAFGVPALGLKRGLENDLVVAPYASLMALMIEPQAALDNLRRLENMAMRGDYGFYESIDFKHQQLGDEDRGSAPSGKRGVVVHTYMVHHQGMALLALDNFLNDYALRRRFSSQPFARAALPLLYEKIPIMPPVLDESVREAPPKPITSVVSPASTERLGTINTPSPRVNLLSNGKMSVLTSNAGGGFARWNEFDLTRWRADTTRDQWGSFVYIRDLESTTTWSAAHQPIKRAAKSSHVHFRPEKTEFSRVDHDIETRLEIFVSPEDDAEIRLLHLTNHSANTRVLEVTSYCELALAPHNADRAHPAFAKLFVQTEALPEQNALLAWRRLRSPHDTPIWAGCVLATATTGQVSYETDRLNFLGRNRTAENPQALESPLTNSAGAVLDPCFSLRQRVVLVPGQRVEMAFTLVAGASRDAVMALVEKFSDLALARRALDLAWTHAQLEMHHLNLDTDLVGQFQHLASYLAYPFDALRAPAKRLRQNRKGQSGLWAYGVSGDLPIMLVTIGDEHDMAVVRQAMQAHEFWRTRGFATDLVILNEEASGYNQELSETLRKAAISFAPQLPQEQIFDHPGGVFIRPADKMPEDDLSLLLAAARVVLVAARGPISQQLGATPALPLLPPRLAIRGSSEEPSAPLPFMELSYFNSLGGFTPDGREYAIYLGPNSQTPAPWVNVIAGPNFGCVMSESGRGFTWFGNSQSNRLTPWSNDAVSEAATEAIYIRDEESGRFWTPTALPIRENDAYRARHGQGYSIFEHNSHAIEQELTVFVPIEGELGQSSPPVKIARLRLKNASSRRRNLSVTQYADWVLGTTREEMQMHLTTAWDTEESILLAHNYYRPDFSERVGFVSSNGRARSFSSDRTAFLGRNGSPSRPAAMEREHLDERCGAGFDSCAAVQVLVDLEPGETTEVIFLIGEAADIDEARNIVRRFRDPQAVEAALHATSGWWDEFLGALQVDVPDASVNFLLNRWLPYQTLSCRVWGRSAWYQSGGAFGFRDQLQDVMALLHSKPQLAREQILRASAHQFEEGDVQHWWHPPSDAGVRTRFADDLLWLPYAVAQYVETTGDAAILDEITPFLRGEPLKDDEHEVYNRPQISPESASLFEHCRRAIEKGCTRGPHDLPLIGTGDWNDGLNRVGVEGKGESVWMGWFLCDVLNRFADLCEPRDAELAADYRKRAAAYVSAIEEHAWDGEWYLRAFFDDGSPMGSKTCEEAKIDSLPQSWAVISGAGDEKRIIPALKAAEEHLVKPDDEMILLFTPAFDQTAQDPGYIKGYLPGVRENGGQYTHAATWLALAFAERGEGDKAVQLLRMLNPVEHAREPEDVWRYKVEPYVVVADVYALEGKVGRGGWTWYTGSASWLYRVWVEAVLGFKLHGDELEINPVLPRDWHEFSMTYRRGGATYRIHVANPDGVNSGVASVELDGIILPTNRIPLADDGQTHEVKVWIATGVGAQPVAYSWHTL